MNVDDLTIGQAKELGNMFSNNNSQTLNSMVGKKVIIRTYSAGVWFGVLSEKAGNEVILTDARRMYRWFCAKNSISLSACAKHGIERDKSKIVEAIESVWLEAIEIIPCSEDSIDSIEGANNAKAE